MTANKISLNETLDQQIKDAENKVAKNYTKLKSAQKNLNESKAVLENLRAQRDLIYIQGLKEIDWKLIFGSDSNETQVIWDYRNHILEQYGLVKSGFVNTATQQQVFEIRFNTDSIEELNDKKAQVKFILSHLIFNPDTHTKTLHVDNILNTQDLWELVYSEVSNTFTLNRMLYHHPIESFQFETLEQALSKIQSLSDTALDSYKSTILIG